MASASVSKTATNAKTRVNGRARDVAIKQAAPSSIKGGDGEIARRAYDLYVARGCEDGHDVEDWLQAERELQKAGDGHA